MDAHGENCVKIHIQRNHSDIKYDCEECNHQTNNLYKLRRHIKSLHEGVKFPCNFCDYQASRKDSLKSHIRAIHEGIKRHK